jgi:hypothetical protein
MSQESNSLQNSQNRLSEILSKADRLSTSIQDEQLAVLRLVEQAVQRYKDVRKTKLELANLRAEATFLRLSEGVDIDEPKIPNSSLPELEVLWKELKLISQPVRASKEWLERIKEVDTKPPRPILTTEEQLELERRLKDNVCPICVSFSLDGTCTLQSFEKCPIDTYLDRLVKMIDEMGHRPWMEDYFERLYRDICPGCAGRVDEDHCPPRDDGECAIFTYLPTIVRTVEDFMKEKAEANSQD